MIQIRGDDARLLSWLLHVMWSHAAHDDTRADAMDAAQGFAEFHNRITRKVA